MSEFQQSKKTKEAPLVVGEVNFACEADLFHPTNNPDGHVHYGTAMNRAIMETIVPYLPSFLTTKDTVYQLPAGNVRFREHIASQTEGLFRAEQTVTCNTVYSLMTILSLHLKTVSITGVHPDTLSFVASHSNTASWKAVTPLQEKPEDVKLHFIAMKNSLDEQQGTPDGVNLEDAVAHTRWLQEQVNVEHVTVLLLASLSQLTAFADLLLDHTKAPIIFALAHPLQEGIQCGVAMTKDVTFLKLLRADAFFYPFSSAAQAAVLGRHEVQQGCFDTLAQTIVTMIDKSEGISSIPTDHVIFGTGGSAILEALGKILFRKGDRIALDAPYYSGFVGDFTRSGLELYPMDYFDEDEVVMFTPQGEKYIAIPSQSSHRRIANTLQLRAKRAYEDGCQGYIVCNPHNPSGRVYPTEEIEALVQWIVEVNQHLANNEHTSAFHVIFDELYSHSVYDLQYRSFTSAIPYSQSSSFIHVVRGFAKDFGLCGFKTGYGFTSNAKVLSLTRSWTKIMRPHPVNAWILQNLLTSTNYGEDIYQKNQVLLANAIAKITKALDDAKISYLIPHAGVFIMINFSPELRANPEENEYTLWKKLLQSKLMNITPGKFFGYKEAGWYRLCPFTSLDILTEGFARLATFVEEELR